MSTEKKTTPVSVTSLCPGDRFLDLAGIEHTVTGKPTFKADGEEWAVPTDRGLTYLPDWREVAKVIDMATTMGSTDRLMADGTFYAFTCMHCGEAVNEDGFDGSGSRRCDDLDPKHNQHTHPDAADDHTDCCEQDDESVNDLRPTEDDLAFARESLGDKVSDEAVYDLAWERNIRDANETA